jgi:transposase
VQIANATFAARRQSLWGAGSTAVASDSVHVRALAQNLLTEWHSRYHARRCRLPSFVKLARTITAQRAGIVAAIERGLSNARVEAINTQIRMITRRAYGFHSPGALIALAMLSRLSEVS